MMTEEKNSAPIAKVISGSAENSFKRWDMPAVGSPANNKPEESARTLTDAQIDEIKQIAYTEAFQQGREEGYQAGLQDAQQSARQLDQLIESLALPFAQQNDEIEEQIVRLAMVTARQLVRRELNIEPGHVIGVVREAMQALPVNCGDARLYLHPDDAKLVAESLGDGDAERHWKMIEDPMMTRGGCRVTAGDTRIDESFEVRIGRVVSNVLGGLRTGESDES